MKVLIFGGTTEGKMLSEQLYARGYDVTLSVATPLGKEILEEPEYKVLVGRLDVPEMKELIPGFSYVVDATHPYATEVTKNIKKACPKEMYLRLLREDVSSEIYRDPGENIILVESAGEAAEFLKKVPMRKVVITTGAKEALFFKDLPAGNRYIRIIDTEEGRKLCEEAGFLKSNVFCGMGPYSFEENVQLFRRTQGEILVTKDGGDKGGLTEKLQAAEECSLLTLLIRRPREEGNTFQEIMEKIKSGEEET